VCWSEVNERRVRVVDHARVLVVLEVHDHENVIDRRWPVRLRSPRSSLALRERGRADDEFSDSRNGLIKNTADDAGFVDASWIPPLVNDGGRSSMYETPRAACGLSDASETADS